MKVFSWAMIAFGLIAFAIDAPWWARGAAIAALGLFMLATDDEP